MRIIWFTKRGTILLVHDVDALADYDKSRDYDFYSCAELRDLDSVLGPELAGEFINKCENFPDGIWTLLLK